MNDHELNKKGCGNKINECSQKYMVITSKQKPENFLHAGLFIDNDEMILLGSFSH